jgi:4-coumarate--CoA ligase
MSYALKTAQVRFLMTTPGSMELAAASAKEAGIPKQNVFLLEGELPGYVTI